MSFPLPSYQGGIASIAGMHRRWGTEGEHKHHKQHKQTQTNTTNSTGQGKPGCSMASPQQALLLRALGPCQSLMAWFSPPQNKRKEIQVVMQLLNQASFMKHISCQEMLPLVSSSAPWDEVLPCPASPASSTAGYTFCQGPFTNTVGLSKTCEHPLRDFSPSSQCRGFQPRILQHLRPLRS